DAVRRQLTTKGPARPEGRRHGEHAKVEDVEQELRVQSALLAEARADQEHKRLELAASSERLADAHAQLAAARARQEELRGELESRTDQLLARQEQIQAQRRRLARKFKVREAEQTAHFEAQARQFAELEQRQAAQLLELTRHTAADQGLQVRIAEQAAEIEKLKADRTSALAELERAQAHGVDAAAGDAQRQAKFALAAEAELDRVCRERDELAQQLQAAEANLQEAAKSDNDASAKDALRQRLELAVTDLREAKRANSELEAKLAKARTDSVAVACPGGALNWEAQKARLLASLEADDRTNDEAVAERHTIEGTIRITDQIVEQKDREIAELKRALEEYSSSNAVSESAVGQLLDGDEIIQRERAKLEEAEHEWRDKIGKAEIDISVERAKLARWRMELEEKMRNLQADQARRAPEDPSGIAKAPRGRWLARLGLKDLDDKS
ncbi:MAG TPA: hypothetical protein VHV08_11170, partial [Pirellulales bacterium]|nr:hypothetical protein [Pirellulales bacterium]